VRRAAVGLMLAVVVGGCPTPGDDDGGTDASANDAGRMDAGLLDAGRDSGTADAGSADSGLADAGRLDSGIADAGGDGGIADSGLQDAGPDRTPPTFAVVVQAPPPVAPPSFRIARWRVDEDPLVAVTWPDLDVDPSSLYLNVVFPDGGQITLDSGVSVASGCTCDGGCACFRVDSRVLPTGLSPPPQVPDYVFGVLGGGSDNSGNASSASGSFELTRIGWEWRPEGLGNIPLMPWVPAIDPEGRVYVGVVDGVTALTPFGTTLWERADGGAIGQPMLALGADAGLLIFSQLSQLELIHTEDGTVANECALQPGATSTPVSASMGARSAAVIAVDDGAESWLLSASFTADSLSAFTCSAVLSPFRVAMGVNPVGIADSICFAATDDSVNCVTLAPDGTWPMPLTTTRVDPTGMGLHSLAVGNFDGVWRIVGTTNGNIFVLSGDRMSETSTFAVESPWDRVTGLTLGVSRMGQIRPLFFSPNDDGLHIMDFDAGFAAYVTFATGTSAQPGHETTAIATSDGTYQWISFSDYLQFSVDDVPYPSVVPTGSWYGLFNVDGANTIFCDPNGRGGIDYGIDELEVLRTTVVDGSGLLDPAASWPKFQRDLANSGNPIPDLLQRYHCP
jgi:hypothetical protein